jgi:hypothetical protein
MFGALAQAILNTRKTTLQTLKTILRPYSSETGAITRGPKAYPRRYIEVMNDPKIELFVLKSCITNSAAGAIIVEARGLSGISDQGTPLKGRWLVHTTRM